MPTCLVIDDEPVITLHLCEQLRELLPEWDVLGETDSKRGLMFIERDDAACDIGLCVVDLTMPGVPGEEVIVRALAHRSDLRGRIIVCTGGITSQRQEERLFRELGCVRLDKPFLREDLRAAVRAAVPNG